MPRHNFFYSRFHATTAVKSFFSAVSIQVRRQQCDSGKRLCTMQASHKAQTQPSYIGSPIPWSHTHKKKCWLFSPRYRFLQPHQAIPHSASSGSIEDFRFPFSINPATALRIHLPTISIIIGNWWKNRTSPLNSELHCQRPYPVAAPRWWVIPPDLSSLPVSLPIPNSLGYLFWSL
jgi:hypothetical protein